MVVIASVEVQITANADSLTRGINEAVRSLQGFSTIGETVNGITTNLNSTAGRAARSMEMLAQSSGQTLVAGLTAARNSADNATSSITKVENQIFRWQQSTKDAASSNQQLIASNANVASAFQNVQQTITRVSTLFAKGELDSISYARGQRQVQEAVNTLNRTIREETSALQANEKAQRDAARAAQELARFKASAAAKVQGFGESIKNVKARNADLIVSNRDVRAEVEKLDRRYILASRVLQDQTATVGQRARAERLMRGSFGQTQRVVDGVIIQQRNLEKASFRAAAGQTRLGLASTEMAKAAQIALGPLSGVAARITAISALANTTTIRIAALISGFIALGAFTAKAVSAGSDFEKEMFLIQQRLRATGQEAKFSSDALNDLAVAVGEQTLASANGARRAIALLLTETSLVPETMERALFAAQDLSALGFGDLESSARRLLRALKDPVGGLEAFSRAGIKFTFAQRETLEVLVETGRQAEATNIVLQELEQNIGGAGVAAAKGLAGAFDTLGERVSRFLEKASTSGGALQGLTNAINRLSEFVLKLSSDADNLSNAGFALRSAIFAVEAPIRLLTDGLDELLLIIGFVAGRKGLLGLLGFIQLLPIRFRRATRAIQAAGAAMFSMNATMVTTTRTIRLLRIGLTSLLSVLGPLGIALALASIAFDIFASKSREDFDEAVSGAELVIKQLDRMKEEIPDDLADEMKDSVKKLNEALTVAEAKLRAVKDAAGFEMFSTPNQTALDAAQSDVDKLKGTLEALQDAEKKVGERAKEAFEELMGETARKAKEEILRTADAARILNDEFSALASGDTVGQALAQSFAKADEVLRKTQESILQAIPKGEENRAQLAAERFAQATAAASEELRKLGFAGATTREILADVFETERVRRVAIEAEKVSQQIDAQAALQNQLNQSILIGGSLRKDVQTELEVQLALIDAQVRRESMVGKAIEENIRRRRALDEATETFEAIDALRDELSLEKVRSKIIGETKEDQEILLAIAEKNVQLLNEGVDLSSDRAKAERGITVEIIKQRQATEKVLEAQRELTDALMDATDALSNSFKEALFEGKALKDIIAELEQKLLDIGLDVLVFGPIKKGLEEQFNALGGGGGVPGILGGIFGPENVGGGLEGVFGKKSTIETGSEAFEILNSKLGTTAEEFTAMTEAMGESKVEAIANAAAKAFEKSEGISLATVKQAEVTATGEATTALFSLAAAAQVAATSMAGSSSMGGLESILNFSGSFGGNPGMPFGGMPPNFVPGFGFTGPRAEGGPVRKGGSFLVGEAGPELFVPAQSGTIVPNSKLGSRQITQNFNINVDSGNSPAFSVDQIASNVMRKTGNVVRRGLA